MQGATDSQESSARDRDGIPVADQAADAARSSAQAEQQIKSTVRKAEQNPRSRSGTPPRSCD